MSIRIVEKRGFICPRCYEHYEVDPRIVFDAKQNEAEGWVCEECKKEIQLKPF